MSRVKYFEIDDSNDELYIEMDFGTYALMMYYAFQVDYQKAIKLFNATLSEWKYRIENDLDEGVYGSDDPTGHYIPSEIQDTIYFIDNQIIPALQNESFVDVINKYGGKENFENIYYLNNDYMNSLGVSDEQYENKYGMIGRFEKLRDIFQEAINNELPHKTWVV